MQDRVLALIALLLLWGANAQFNTVAIPAGEVEMGDSDDQPWSPERTVGVSPFDIDTELVTRFDFMNWLNDLEAVDKIRYDSNDQQVYLVDTNSTYDGLPLWYDSGSYYTDDGDDLTINFDLGATDEEMMTPMQWVTYFGAIAYAEAFDRDLPTEAEWMRAADNGEYDDQTWWCGYTDVDGGVWCGGNKSGPRTYFTDQAGFATSFGLTDILQDTLRNDLKDMRGNLRQWTKDWQANPSFNQQLIMKQDPWNNVGTFGDGSVWALAPGKSYLFFSKKIVKGGDYLTSKDSIDWMEFQALDPMSGHDHVGFRTVHRTATLTEFQGTIKMCEFNQYTRYNCIEDPTDPKTQHCEFECYPCAPECETCNGPTAWECKSCHAFAHLVGTSCACWSDDQAATTTNLSDPTTCSDTNGCSRGQGWDSSSCITCDPLCKYCNGPTKDECLEYETTPNSEDQSGCYTGFVYSYSTSTDTDGFTPLYHSECEPEEGFEADTRDTTGATIYPSSGLDIPCFHYQFIENGSCGVCDASCLTCSGTTDQDCTDCEGNRRVSLADTTDTAGPCICEDGFSGPDCNTVGCPSACQTCLTGSDRICTTCADAALAVKSDNMCHCVNDNDYWDGSQCQPCDPRCGKCEGPVDSNCTECKDYAFLLLVETTDEAGECQCIHNYEYDDTTFECKPITYCDDCNPGTYNDEETGEETACDDSCRTCLGAGPDFCTTCPNNARLEFIVNPASEETDRLCQSGQMKGDVHYENCMDPTYPYGECKCDNNYFLNETTKTCEACDPSCNGCTGPYPDDCTECRNGGQVDLYIGQCLCEDVTQVLNEDGLCVVMDGTCVHYSLFEDGGACSPCDWPCASCSGNSVSCTGCFYPRVLDAGSCGCADGFFENWDTLECEACHHSCATCQGATEEECLSCHQDSRVIALDDQSVTVGRCDCHADLMYDPISAICLRVGYTGCEDDQYRAEDGHCKACHTSCYECVGPEDYHCTQCNADYECAKDENGEDITNQCRNVREHRGVTHSFGRCLCASGFYLAPDYDCHPCHNKCKECIGPSESQCTQCKERSDTQYLSTGDATSTTNYFIGLTCICDENAEPNDEGICVTKKYGCDWHQYTVTQTDGTSTGTTGENCANCAATCESCHGSGQGDCLSCWESWELRLEGTQTSCYPPYGYWADINSTGQAQLQKCGDGCAECDRNTGACLGCKQNTTKSDDPEAKSCTCPPGFEYDLDEECVPEYAFSSFCRYNQFYDRNSLQCEACHNTCETCYGPESSQCTSCYDRMLYDAAYNSCRCDDGYYMEASYVEDESVNFCQPCQDGCRTCSGATYCDVIADNAATDLDTACNCYPCEPADEYVWHEGERECVYWRHVEHCEQNEYWDENNTEETTQEDGTKIADVVVGECKLCHSDCLSCMGPGRDDCLLCPDTVTKHERTPAEVHQESGINAGTCECDYGQTRNGDECMTCANLCAGCTDDTNAGCDYCVPFAYAENPNPCTCITGYADDGNGNCVSEGTCDVTQCPTGCTGCTDDQGTCDLCTSCESGDESCINNCDVTCASCDGSQQCDTCKPILGATTLTMQPNGDVCECPMGFTWDDVAFSCTQGSVEQHYQDDQGVYHKCEGVCTACYGPSNQECLECVDYRRLESNSCHCKVGFYYDWEVASANITTDSAFQEDPCKGCDISCAACVTPEHAETATSSGGTCTECASGFVREGLGESWENVFNCVCPQNTVRVGASCDPINLDTEHSCYIDMYYDETSETCESCVSPCASCFKDSTFCLSCARGMETEQLDDGYVECVCAEGSYDDGQGTCEPCDDLCALGCNGPSVLHCWGCHWTAIWEDSVGCACPADSTWSATALECTPNYEPTDTSYSCNPGYVWDTATTTCLACLWTCSHCEMTNVDSCLSCDARAHRYLFVDQQNVGFCLCKDGYFEEDNTEVSTSGIPADASKNTCQKCGEDSCATCTGRDYGMCTVCKTGFDLNVHYQNSDGADTGDCVCSSGTFWAENMKMCLPLNNDNSTCNPTDVTTQQDLAEWQHPEEDRCLPCHETCAECVGPENGQCISCKDGFECHTSSFHSSLVECNCPDGTYYDGLPATDVNNCKPCHAKCGTCDGYSSSRCKTCAENSYAVAEIVGFRCECETGYTLDTNDDLCKPTKLPGCADFYMGRDEYEGTCFPCHDTCETCKGSEDKPTLPVHCTQCKSKYAFLFDANWDYGDEVDERQYIDEEEEGATAKRANYPDIGTCTCFDGWYMDPSDDDCYKCPASCSKCTDANTCTECKEYSTLNPDQNQPDKCPCSAGTAQKCGGECIPTTIDARCHWSQYYVEFETAAGSTVTAAAAGYCEQCDHTCGSCIGEGEDKCESCRAPFELVVVNQASSGRCTCSDGYYEELSDHEGVQTRVCAKCHFACLTCTGLGDTFCTDCAAGFDQVNGQGPCVCPENTYWHNDLELCVEETAHEDGKYPCLDDAQLLINCDCHPSCFNCFGSSEEDCTQCKYGQRFEEENIEGATSVGRCICEHGFYELTSGACAQCSNSCDGCHGQGSSSCDKCADDFIKNEDNDCVCPENFYYDPTATTGLCQPINYGDYCDTSEYNDEGECLECDFTCLSCIGGSSNNCLTCHHGSTLVPSGCGALTQGYCACAEGFYLEDEINECVACHSLCKTCSGPSQSECDSCAWPRVAVDVSGQISCDCPDGYYEGVGATRDCILVESTNNCEAGTYQTNFSGECESCETSTSGCQACTRHYNGNCLACPLGSGMTLTVDSGIQGFCACGARQWQSFPAGEEGDLEVVTCQECHPMCLTCDGSAIENCITCNNLAIKDSAGICICDAEENSHYDEEARVCYKEGSPIDFGNGVEYNTEYIDENDRVISCDYRCEGCAGPSYRHCLACASGFTTQYDTAAGPSLVTCTCPDGQYMDPTGVCIDCMNGCAKCTQECNCLECDEGRHPEARNDETVCACNACLVETNERQDDGTDILVCLPEGTSVFCAVDEYTPDGTCTCEPCDPTCGSCTGPTSDECRSCAPNMRRRGTGDDTSGACHNSGTCECIDGLYWHDSDSTCTACDPAQNCLTCSSSSYCDTCVSDRKLDGVSGGCLCKDGLTETSEGWCEPDPTADDACAPGTYGTPATGCYECDSSCVTCSGQGPFACLSCNYDAFFTLEQSQDAALNQTYECVCDDGYYVEYTWTGTVETSQCKQCDPLCGTCSAAGPENCDSCADSDGVGTANAEARWTHTNGYICECDSGTQWVESLRACVPYCAQPNEYIVDYYTDTNGDRQPFCDICDISCDTCNGGAANECLTCSASAGFDAAPENGVCKCTGANFYDEGACVSCLPGCEKCVGAGREDCQQCTAPATLSVTYNDGDTCYGICACPQNFDIDPATGLCETYVSAPTACQQGQFIEHDGTCTDCTQPLCVQCTDGYDQSCAICEPEAELNVFENQHGVAVGKCRCKYGYMLSDDETACIPCDPSCASCTNDGTDNSSPTTCQQCAPQRELDTVTQTCVCKQGIFVTESDGSCTESAALNCPVGEYKGQVQCGSCNPPRDASAGDDDGNCVCCTSCDQSCEHCSGPGENDCLTCREELGFEHAAPQSADTGSYSTAVGREPGYCVCRTGTTVSVVNEGCTFGFECVACHASCSACEGTSADQCTSCNQGAELMRNADGTVPISAACICKEGYQYNPLSETCTVACTVDGKYLDTVVSTCTADCVSPCANCVGESPYECLTCLTGFVATPVAGTTLVFCNCDAGQWYDFDFDVSDTNDTVCKPCHASCATCNFGSEYDCLTCHDDSFLVKEVATLEEGQCHCNYGITRDGLGKCHPEGTSSFCGVSEYAGDAACEPCHYSCWTCDGARDTNCVVCRDFATKQADGSCECNRGYFMNTTGACTPCMPNCLSCDSFNYCDECDSQTSSLDYVAGSVTGDHVCECNTQYYFTDTNGYCILSPTSANCPSNQYEQNNTCQDCHDDCESCIGPGSDECVICTDPTKHVAEKLGTTNGGKCECKLGYFADGTGCSACHHACEGLRCEGTEWDDCLECVEGGIYVANEGCRECEDGYTYNTFVEQCIPATYCQERRYPGEAGECLFCDPSCNACVGPTAANCTECAGDRLYELSYVEIGDIVTYNCTCDYFQYDTGNSCRDCHELCDGCYGDSKFECLQCTENAHFEYDELTYESYCKCNSNAEFDTSVGRCVEQALNECVIGQWRDCSLIEVGEPPECLDCDPSCYSCVGRGPDYCLTCKPNAEFRPLYEGEAVEAYIKMGSCVCIDGFYWDSDSEHCEPCHPTCERCVGPSQDLCIGGCRGNTVPVINVDYNNAIFECSCPLGTVEPDCTLAEFWTYCEPGEYEINGGCQACHSSCGTCIGPRASDCTACRGENFMNAAENETGDSFACECVVGFYNECGTCLQCEPSCKTCSGPAAADCLSCFENATEDQGICVCDQGYTQTTLAPGLTVCQADTCNDPSNEYIDYEGECHTCHPLCADCVGPGRDQCISCIHPSEATRNEDGITATCKCSSSMYFGDDNGTLGCLDCDSDCQMCAGCPFNCIACDEGANGQSLQFDDESYGSCGCAEGFLETDAGCEAINPNGCDAMEKYLEPCANELSADGQFDWTAVDDWCCSAGSTPGTDACHESCYTCYGPYSDECETCKPDSFTRWVEGECLCISDLYYELDQGICDACDPSCAGCDGGNTNQDCYACSGNASIDFSSSHKGECVDCHETCETCSGGSDLVNACNSCYPNAVIVENNVGDGFGTCDCLPGYERSATSTTDTVTCHLKVSGNCGAGQYQEASGTCENCNGSCLACNGGAATECTACDANEHKTLVVVITGAEFGECKCAANTYEYVSYGNTSGSDFSVNEVCVPCHGSCGTCWEGGCDTCTTCAPNSAQDATAFDGICRAEADYYWSARANSFKLITDDFFHNENGGMDRCHETCKTCVGPDAAECLDCKSGYVYVQDESDCHNTWGYCRCETGKFDGLQCVPCNGLCERCSQDDQCYECITYSHLETTTGECFCDVNYTADYSQDPPVCGPDGSSSDCNSDEYLGIDSTGQEGCYYCDNSCQTCDGEGPNACLTCQDGQTFNPCSGRTGSCLCGKGKYVNNGMCTDCQVDGCDVCTEDGAECKRCAPDRVLNTNSCDACEEGFSWDAQSSSCQFDPEDGCTSFGQTDPNDDSACVPCHDVCGSCLGHGNDLCTSCRDPSMTLKKDDPANDVVGRCICKEGTYFDWASNSCSSCPLECEVCGEYGECLSCWDHLNQELQGTTCGCKSDYLFNECLQTCVEIDDTCLENEYKDAANDNCATCHETCGSCIGPGRGDCTTCNVWYVPELSATGSASSQYPCGCPAGQFYKRDDSITDDVSKCEPCDDSCLTCDGAAAKCTECAHPDMTLDTAANTCTSPCGYDCTTTFGTCEPIKDNDDCLQNEYYDSNTEECKLCHGSCVTCLAGPDAELCMVCKEHSHAVDDINDNCDDGFSCEADDGYFYDDFNLTFTQCNTGCMTCDGLNSGCTSCAEGAYVDIYDTTGNCTCMTGWTPDSEGGCTFQQNNPYEDQCPKTDGQLFHWYDQSDQRCKQCDPRCLLCDGSSNTKCSGNTCRGSAVPSADSVAGQSPFTCVCPSGSFPDVNVGRADEDWQCRSCAEALPNCETCTTQSTCITCFPPWVVDTSASSSDKGHCICPAATHTVDNLGFCVKDVGTCDPRTEFLDNGVCLACNDACSIDAEGCTDDTALTCDACKPEYTQVTGFGCVCNNEAKRNQGDECTACHVNCLRCSEEADATKCTQCHPNASKKVGTDPAATEWECECSGEAYGDDPTQCIPLPACREKSYFNTVTGDCESCHANCAECSGQRNTDCDSCVEGAVKQANGSCECPADFYYNPVKGKCDAMPTCGDGTYRYQKNSSNEPDVSQHGVYDCAPCHRSCKTCTGEENYQCTKGTGCANVSLTFIANASATDGTGTCGCTVVGKYYDEQQNFCSDCKAGCLSCQNGYSCLECDEAKGYTWDSEDGVDEEGNIQCRCKIWEGFFWDSSSRSCQACNASCLRCVGTGNDLCTECEEGTKRLWKQNVNDFTGRCMCNKGYYHAGNGACEEKPDMYACAGPSYVVDSGNGIDGKACEACDDTCEDCVGPNASQCVMCSSNRNFIPADYNDASYVGDVPGTCECKVEDPENPPYCLNQACEPGYYKDFEDNLREEGECRECHPACLTCECEFDWCCNECNDRYEHSYGEVGELITCECQRDYQAIDEYGIEVFAIDESDDLFKPVCQESVVVLPEEFFGTCPLSREGCDLAEEAQCVWTVETAATATNGFVRPGQIDEVLSSPQCIRGLYAYCCDEDTLGICNNILQTGAFDQCTSIAVPEVDKARFSDNGTQVIILFKSRIQINYAEVIDYDGYLSCWSLFEGFNWEAECKLDQSGKGITMTLFGVDCSDYTSDKTLVLRANIYGAATENATVYNQRTEINNISPPTPAAGTTNQAPELEMLAPTTISLCSSEIIYTYFSQGSGMCQPTVTWSMVENPAATFTNDEYGNVFLDRIWWETLNQVTVTVTATNIFGEVKTKTVSTTIESEWVPEVNLPDEIYESREWEIFMGPWIEIPDACSGTAVDFSNLQITITWGLADGEVFDDDSTDGLTQTKWNSTIQPAMQTAENRDFLVIPENTLLTTRSYNFEVSVATNVNTKVAKAQMLVFVEAPPLEVYIEGRKDSINVRNSLNLEAIVYDPQDPNGTDATSTYTYVWGCEDWTDYENDECPLSYYSGIDEDAFSPETFEEEYAFNPGFCLDGLTPGADLMTRLVTNTNVLTIGENSLVSGKRYVFTADVVRGTTGTAAGTVEGWDAACIEATSNTSGSLVITKYLPADNKQVIGNVGWTKLIAVLESTVITDPTYTWTQEGCTGTACVSSANAKPFGDNTTFKIKGENLAEGTVFTWKCTVSSATNPDLSVSAKWQASKNNAPTIGTFQVEPNAGDVSTEFQAKFDQVVDIENDNPFKYEIAYKFRDIEGETWKTYKKSGQVPIIFKLPAQAVTSTEVTSSSAVLVRGFVTDAVGSISKYYYATVMMAEADQSQIDEALTSESSKISDASLSTTERMAAATTAASLTTSGETDQTTLSSIISGVKDIPLPTDPVELKSIARSKASALEGLAGQTTDSLDELAESLSDIAEAVFNSGVSIEAETAELILSSVLAMMFANQEAATSATGSTDTDSTDADSTTTASTTTASTTDTAKPQLDLAKAMSAGLNSGESSTTKTGNTTLISTLEDAGNSIGATESDFSVAVPATSATALRRRLQDGTTTDATDTTRMMVTMKTDSFGEKVPNVTNSNQFFTSSMVDINIYDGSYNELEIDFTNQTTPECIWVSVDITCPTNMTCPNKGEYNPKKGTTGYVYLDEYDNMNQLEVQNLTNNYTMPEIDEWELAATYWDANATDWSTTGLNQTESYIDWETSVHWMCSYHLSSFASSFTAKPKAPGATVSIFLDDREDNDYNHEVYEDMNPVYVGLILLAMCVTLIILGELMDRHYKKNTIVPTHTPGISLDQSQAPNDKALDMSQVSATPEDDVKEIGSAPNKEAVLFVNTENAPDRIRALSISAQMTARKGDGVETLELSEGAVSFRDYFTRELLIVSYLMHYRATFPRSAKVAMLFSILALQFMATSFIIAIVPEWYYAGLAGMAVGPVIAPLLAFIYYLPRNMSKDMYSTKRVLGMLVTLVIFFVSGAWTFYHTGQFSETEMNEWMIAYAVAAGFELLVGDLLRTLIKYGIFKQTAADSKLGKFVRES